ncbi:VCBS domain-containing protein [Algibacillus agarilyticus]|uniref:VCBS domain-containing protein n=1 Tax=Algibacillus agarilyticus TaxID=2234133 RepID=UPI000DCFEA21|nr:VCBS domain-containing protein [Algibacillus agarilyticus]
MQKQILALSIIAALSACEIDNSAEKELPAKFNNEFTTTVGFNGTSGEGMDVPLILSHGNATGTFGVTDANWGEADLQFEQIGVEDTDITQAEVPEGETRDRYADTARVLKTMYGTFKIKKTADGYSEWSYVMDKPAVLMVEADENAGASESSGCPTFVADEDNTEDNKALAALLVNCKAADLVDSIELTSIDGSQTALNFVISGVDQQPAEVKGDLVANVNLRFKEKFGLARVYDPNYEESYLLNKVLPVDENQEQTPKYGTIDVQPNGQWTYTIRPEKIEELRWQLPTELAEPVQESFYLVTNDGTKQLLEVFITLGPRNFVPSVPVASEESDDKGIFEVQFIKSGTGVEKKDLLDGKLQFKAKITDDLAKKATISLYCSRWHGSYNRRLTSFIIQPEGDFEMWSAGLKPGGAYGNVNDFLRSGPNNSGNVVTQHVKFDRGFQDLDWHEVTLTFKRKEGAALPKMTLLLDGEPLGTTEDHPLIPRDTSTPFYAQTLTTSDSIAGCTGRLNFTVDKVTGDEAEPVEATGSLLVDDIRLFTDPDADVKFDTPVFEDDFDSNKEDDLVSDADSFGRYQNVTTDKVVIKLDL